MTVTRMEIYIYINILCMYVVTITGMDGHGTEQSLLAVQL